MRAIISIHDVMPETLPQTAQFLATLSHWPPANICLLVVPGCDWQAEDIRQLQSWQAQGYELAGHGWRHRAYRVSSLYHRWHSALISRDCAEHLSLKEADIIALMECSYLWFQEHELMPPALYVPPAWAMGAVKYRYLARLPFHYYETQFGFYDSQSGYHRWLPLIGFEARDRGQARILNLSNRINHLLHHVARPVRIAIHPHDRQYRLAESIDSWLGQVTEAVNYRDSLAVPGRNKLRTTA